MSISEQPLQSSTPSERDPNIAQRKASNPEQSVWVSASAGTGKTKVLTDRVLRLLLPSENREATSPHKILCLTFTNNAAAEMLERVSGKLSDWAVMSETELHKHLEKELLGQPPSDAQLSKAKQLFAQTIDCPGGLKIMTIHAFCQSILARFPIEAGLLPGAQILEESTAQQLRRQAFTAVMEGIRAEERQEQDKPILSQALDNLLRSMAFADFERLIASVLSARHRFESLLEGRNGLPSLIADIYFALGVEEGQTEEDYIAQMWTQIDQTNFAYLFETLDGSTDAKQKLSLGLQDAIRKRDLAKLRSLLLTQEDTLKSLRAQKLESDEGFMRQYVQLGELILDCLDRQKSLLCAKRSEDVLLIGMAVISAYEQVKAQEAGLDFDDLIHKTAQMLEHTVFDEMAQGGFNASIDWVMYKLDGGIDHILVDEAQDTSPAQWRIISALAEEFFSGDSAREDIIRTLFVVGDEKQSIYSFQGADLKTFTAMRREFGAKIKAAGQEMEPVPLNISFRTVQSVLDLVDKVFDSETMRLAVSAQSEQEIRHISHREGQAGFSCVWPLVTEEKNERKQSKTNAKDWPLPVHISTKLKAPSALATEIAAQIRKWLDEGLYLPSRGRNLQADDILILVRNRTPMVRPLMQALKAHGVPLSGADKMILRDEISVMDCLQAVSFTLLPEDDLGLATLLKSPFIGMDEQALFDLAQPRGKLSLWDQMKGQVKYQAIINWCHELMDMSSKLDVYGFLSQLLYSPCPASEQSGLYAMTTRLGADCFEPLQALLLQAQDFDREHTSGLQGFVHFMQSNEASLKSEADKSSGAVRIMTVHGAKGLQAPIVFMADTTGGPSSAGSKSDRLLWPDQTELGVPLFASHKEYEPKIYQEGKARLKDQDIQEYKRLLYVAMTRAEDGLYVAGAKGQKAIPSDCWYHDIRNALSQIDGVEVRDYIPLSETALLDEDTQSLHLNSAQTAKKGDRLPDVQEIQETKPQRASPDAGMPSWVRQNAPEEPTPPRPLTPSRPSQSETMVARSPLDLGATKTNEARFLRGNLTHALLQFLPDLQEQDRLVAARRYLSQPGHGISEILQKSIAEETVAILNHPDFHVLFGPGSRAEVPLAGLLGDHALSGQIDRLLIEQDKVWIVDYKTNRPSPESPEDVPPVYKAQMQSYYDALRVIFPNKELRCFLLWTDQCNFMEIKCR